MENAKKVSLVSAAVAIVGVLLLTGLYSVAQEQPLREVYQAQARGQGPQLGRTFNITLNLEGYSTPEERQVLIDAFKTAGSQGLFNALNKMKSKGRMAITGTLGYDVSYVRKLPVAGGFKLRVLTNRPITFGENWTNSRSSDYNLSALELDLNTQTGKGTGVLMPATQFKIDAKTGEVTIEAFQNPWTIVSVEDRTKK